ncbi:MAG TPA: Na+/H+ antiporter subunit E [Trueperaceae bacterium]
MLAEILVVVAVSLLWAFLYGEFTTFNLLVGALLGMLLLLLVRRERSSSLPRRLWRVLRFVVSFLAELVVACVTIARLTVSREPRFHPHVIAVPLRVESDAAISLLAATITLLPGTVAMGTSQDGRTLYAHAIGEADPARSRDSVVRIESLILGFMR